MIQPARADSPLDGSETACYELVVSLRCVQCRDDASCDRYAPLDYIFRLERGNRYIVGDIVHLMCMYLRQLHVGAWHEYCATLWNVTGRWMGPVDLIYSGKYIRSSSQRRSIKCAER